VTRWLRLFAWAALAAGVAAAGWFGWRTWQDRQRPPATVVQELGDEPAADTVETVEVEQPTIVTAGTTPMRQRVAVLGLLNKRNGRARDVVLKPGFWTQVGDVRLHLRACEKTAPWEPDQLTGAFVQVDVKGSDGQWRRPFSGWLYKERPNLNVVQHAVYDVWTKSCTMSFPATGPDTERLGASGAGGTRSRARQSPAAGSAPAATPTEPATADDSADR
jgi:hypothetical protein